MKFGEYDELDRSLETDPNEWCDHEWMWEKIGAFTTNKGNSYDVVRGTCTKCGMTQEDAIMVDYGPPIQLDTKQGWVGPFQTILARGNLSRCCAPDCGKILDFAFSLYLDPQTPEGKAYLGQMVEISLCREHFEAYITLTPQPTEGDQSWSSFTDDDSAKEREKHN